MDFIGELPLGELSLQFLQDIFRCRSGTRMQDDQRRRPFLTLRVVNGDDGRLQEAGGLTGQRPERDQLVERVGRQDELADVDRPVPARDVGDDDVR